MATPVDGLAALVEGWSTNLQGATMFIDTECFCQRLRSVEGRSEWRTCCDGCVTEDVGIGILEELDVVLH